MQSRACMLIHASKLPKKCTVCPCLLSPLQVAPCAACVAPRVLLSGPSVVGPSPCGPPAAGGDGVSANVTSTTASSTVNSTSTTTSNSTSAADRAARTSSTTSNAASLLPFLLATAAAMPPTFDASRSYDPSGRATWAGVRWSLAPLTAIPNTLTNITAVAAASRAVLQAAVDRTNALPTPRSRLRLYLTAAEADALDESLSYGLTVTLTSWLRTAATATWRFAKAPAGGAGGTLAVAVVGPASQRFRLASGLRAEAEVAACPGAGVTTLLRAGNGERAAWAWVRGLRLASEGPCKDTGVQNGLAAWAFRGV